MDSFRNYENLNVELCHSVLGFGLITRLLPGFIAREQSREMCYFIMNTCTKRIVQQGAVSIDRSI